MCLLQKRAEVSTFAPDVFIKAGERMKDDVEVAAYVARQEERRKIAAEKAKSAELIASLQAENSRYMAENSKYMAKNAMLRELLAQKG